MFKIPEKLSSDEKRNLTVGDLLSYMGKHGDRKMHVLTEKHESERDLNQHAINRPGMNLFGYFDHFGYNRIQVFGRGEHAYLKKLCEKKELGDIEKFLSYAIPIILFSHNNTPPEEFVKLAEANGIAVVKSVLPTLKLIQGIHDFFDDSVLIKQVHYGVMMEIYGSGVLIQGPSGIGKSECALELLERGHRFVADDVVNIKRLKNQTLIGLPSPVLATHMEFKGIGIINVAHLFGVRSILKEKQIELVIRLEIFDENKDYRDSEDAKRTFSILDVELPMIVLPIKKASNIPILIETTTMNERLKRTGYDTAKEFNKRIMKITQKPATSEKI